MVHLPLRDTMRFMGSNPKGIVFQMVVDHFIPHDQYQLIMFCIFVCIYHSKYISFPQHDLVESDEMTQYWSSTDSYVI